jgi:hypothetical protein
VSNSVTIHEKRANEPRTHTLSSGGAEFIGLTHVYRRFFVPVSFPAPFPVTQVGFVGEGKCNAEWVSAGPRDCQ